MGTSHPLSVTTNNHAFTARTYANVAARDADSAFHSVSTNLDKVVRVDSPLAFYILTAITPTWESLGASLNDEWTELSDTPASITANQLVQGNSGGTALEFTARPTLEALTLTSTTGFFRLNRLTTTQRDALTPLNGMVIFNTTTTQHETYDGTSWVGTGVGGDVSKVGTPVNDQVGVWTGDGTIEGTVNLTFDNAQLLVPNGTELLPSASFVNDPDTGMRRVSADILGFSAKGFDVLHLTANATATTYLKVTAEDNDTGGVDNDLPILLEAESSLATTSLSIKAKDSNLFLNRASGAGPVEIGKALGAGSGVLIVQSGAPSVGIGAATYTPSTGEMLRIQDADSGATRTRMAFRSPVNSNILTLGINQTSVDGGSAFIQNVSTTDLDLITSAGTAIAISSLNTTLAGDLDTSGFIRMNATSGAAASMTFKTSTATKICQLRFEMDSVIEWIIRGDSDLSPSEFKIVDSISGTDPLRIIFGSPTNSLVINSAGVGINKATPIFALDVVGDLQLTGAFRDTSGDVGTSGQVLSSTVTGTNWITAGGGGDVTKVGTPVNNEVGVWTGDGTIEGDTNLTFNGSLFAVGGSTPLSDLTIFQNGTLGERGLTLSGTTISGSGTVDGVNLSLGSYFVGGMQLWIGQESDLGSASKVFFRMEVGGDVPRFGAVSGNGASNRNLHIGSGDSFVGIGDTFLTQADIETQLHTQQSNPDTTAIITVETKGTNPGIVKQFVGNRDPNANVTGAGGDEYNRDSAGTSASYESKELTTGTEWFKRTLLPPKDFELNTQAELDALFSGGVRTVTSGTTIFPNLQLTTADRFVISGVDLTMCGKNISESGISYSGTGTFISATVADSQFQCFDAMDLQTSSTGTFMDMNGTILIENETMRDWDLLGTVNNGAFIFRHIDLVRVTGGWTIVNPFSTLMHAVSMFGTAFTGVFVTYSNASVTLGNHNFSELILSTFSSTATAFDISLTSNKSSPITINNVQIPAGNLFKKSTVSNATINSVADSAISAGALTAMADNSSGGTTVSCTATYFNSEEITITGTTSYNATNFIFNVVAGVSFDIPITFVADDATGASNSARLALTMTAGHGIVVQDDLKIIDTNFYNGFAIALNFPSTDVVLVNGVFVSTNAGAIERNVGLDQSDPRINAFDNFGFPSSANIACAHVNDNSTANGSITNNTFTDMVFGTAASALIASSTMERWRLTDELNGTFEYFGLTDFDGLITFDFTVESSGGTVDFRFKWLIDKGAGFVDLDDVVESLVAVGSDAQSVTKTFPLLMNKGDKIKPQITRNSGSSGITTIYASIYCTSR